MAAELLGRRFCLVGPSLGFLSLIQFVQRLPLSWCRIISELYISELCCLAANRDSFFLLPQSQYNQGAHCSNIYSRVWLWGGGCS